jgi:hypothetical protein
MGLPSDGHFVSGRAWYFSILGSRWGDRGFEGLPPFTPGNAEVKSIFTCLYRFGSVLFGRFCIKIFYETHFDTPGTSKPPNPTASNPKTLNPGAQHQGRGPGFGVEGRAFGLTPPLEAMQETLPLAPTSPQTQRPRTQNPEPRSPAPALGTWFRGLRSGLWVDPATLVR